VDNNVAAAVTQPLVSGLANVQIWYGIKRNTGTVDNNVDTYLRADDMSTNDAVSGLNDWTQVSSVRIILTFKNPLANGDGKQPATIDFERVIAIMSKAGVSTS
jgi:hypothetical protein